MTNSRRALRVLAIAALVAGIVLLAARGFPSGVGEGPMERGGKAMDRAGEKIGDAFR